MGVIAARLTQPAEAASRSSFWAKVDMLGDCWTWNGARSAFGHGKVGYGGKYFGAHVCVYEYTYGRLEPGKFVCHHCDNPRCVNPAHLYAGTPKQNTADMYRRGRAANKGAIGSANRNAALTEGQVLEIRTRFADGGVTPDQLATQYGSSPGAINQILRGSTWRHVGGPIQADRRGRHGNHLRGPNHPRSTREAA